jgi:ATP-binding cassette, subfamily F, member 3
MLIVRIEQVSLSYGTKPLLKNVSLSLNDGEKIGLVGPNGAGKSTLLRLLANSEKPNAGEVTMRRGVKVAYLPQEYAGDGLPTALDEVLAGRPDLLQLERELEKVEADLSDPRIAGDMTLLERALETQAALLEKYDESGGTRLRNEARGWLEKMGMAADDYAKPLTLLSGGQRKMVGLARCLVQNPDLLLLDEPDNHLDLPGKALLEEILQEYDGALILISHDRYLLDDTVAEIAEISDGNLTLFQGNYSSYETQRELALLNQQQQFVAQQKEIKRLEEAIARFKLWASIVVDKRHILQARNKQRQIDRMDKVERPVLERRKMGLAFKAHLRGGQKVVEARHLAKTFDENIVLLDVNFTVMRGERIGIIGRNGSGKSVLFSLLQGQSQPDDGNVWVGPSIRQGSYSQHHEMLNFDQTPIEFLRNLRPMTENEAVGWLGRFLFNYRQANEPIRQLSGGEKSRLQLTALMLSGANCLLLDEPTNHLDIASTEVLEDALNNFEGTVIAISHDRYFLDRVCTRIFELENGEIREYIGGYSDYAAKKATPVAPPPAPVAKVASAPPKRPVRK